LPAISAGARKRNTCQNGFGGEDGGGVVGVVAAAEGALGDLGAGLGDGLAHLGGDQGGEICGLGLEQVRELAHAKGAMCERDVKVLAEGDLGEADLLEERLFGERGEVLQELAGGRVEGLDGHTWSLDFCSEGNASRCGSI
jgi:hypothetical protein